MATLDLSRKEIGDEGVSSLSTALMNENNKVATLDLSRNEIAYDGAQSLSKALMDAHIIGHLTKIL